MRGFKITIFGMITVSLDMRTVNLFLFLFFCFLFFSCSLRTFVSRFPHSRIRAIYIFFRREGHRPPSPEVPVRL